MRHGRTPNGWQILSPSTKSPGEQGSFWIFVEPWAGAWALLKQIDAKNDERCMFGHSQVGKRLELSRNIDLFK
jgi:hypothetical protein